MFEHVNVITIVIKSKQSDNNHIWNIYIRLNCINIPFSKKLLANYIFHYFSFKYILKCSQHYDVGCSMSTLGDIITRIDELATITNGNWDIVRDDYNHSINRFKLWTFSNWYEWLKIVSTFPRNQGLVWNGSGAVLNVHWWELCLPWVRQNTNTSKVGGWFYSMLWCANTSPNHTC